MVSHKVQTDSIQRTEAHVPRVCARQQEKLPQGEARALQPRVAPAPCNKRKPSAATETHHSQKIKMNKSTNLTVCI